MLKNNFALNVPINNTSLGQVSICLLKELFKRDVNINIFPIGKVDLGTQKVSQEFISWLDKNARNAISSHQREVPTFKLWHLNGSLESLSNKQVLLTFYEVDRPTEAELNIVKNNTTVLFSSNYAISKFRDLGSKNIDFIPLAFDSDSFYKTEKKKTDSIQFGLFGKLEPQRKRHLKTLSTWAKKYGNNPQYSLNCAIFNQFLDPAVQSQIISQALNGKQYSNINFLPFLPENSLFNDLLNNIDITLAMSGGEGWGLPEFQATALGKHCVGLRAHSYKEWMDENNSVLVSPNSKIPVYDNIFFKEGLPFNQGEIFDWNEDEFISAMEEAEKRFHKNPENTSGLKLQENFTYTKFTDKIISTVDSIN